MPGVAGTMKEFSAGKLHSGSKKGPVVKSKKQAVAIALSQGRKAGEDVPPPKAAVKRKPFSKHGGKY